MAWVMFVSVFCFVMTLVWMIVFGFGCHRSSATWAAMVGADRRTQMGHHTSEFWCVDSSVCVCVCVQDFAYHGIAAFFYLSAAVILAFFTIINQSQPGLQIYKAYVSAVVRTCFVVKWNQKLKRQKLTFSVCSSGVCPCCHPPLLHPHHLLRHPMETFLRRNQHVRQANRRRQRKPRTEGGKGSTSLVVCYAFYHLNITFLLWVSCALKCTCSFSVAATSTKKKLYWEF